jgi:formylglycine-generating enzyme required for sulfatase activity
MAGNVWEWTRSIYQAYPYDPTDGREDLKAGDEAPWVLRGGLFNYGRRYVRCAARYWFNPIYRDYGIGFRVVLVGVPPSPLSSEPSGRAPVMASIIAR